MAAPQWKRLRSWPQDAEGYLGLPAGTEAFCRHLFEQDRLRFEILHAAGDEREIRIPCRHGELFPVSGQRWGWIGAGGTWARKALRVLGRDAYYPLSDATYALEDVGTKHDECQVHFRASRVTDVARLLKARKRQTPRNASALGKYREAG